MGRTILMKVFRPSKNPLTQDYSSTHKGYDFSGKGDQNIYASFDGIIVECKNDETNNWIAGNRPLTTADYGNYAKIKGIEGFQLVAHALPYTLLPKGAAVLIGEVIGQIGNTGNSTAKHLHGEYKFLNGINTPVDFDESVIIPTKDDMPLTDQSKINFGFEIGELELQAVRSKLRELNTANGKISELEKTVSNLQAQIITLQSQLNTTPTVGEVKPITVQEAWIVIIQFLKSLFKLT